MLVRQIRGAFSPSTLDEAAGTVEVLASTGADVRRGGFVERLDLAGAEFEPGTPVLDSHRHDGLDRLLGTVAEWRREAEGLVAKVQLGQRGRLLLDDIRSGVLKGVSIGYAILQARDSRLPDGTPLRTATRFRIHELSFVPIGADPSAVVRAEEKTMPDTTTVEPGDQLANRATQNNEIRTIARLSGLSRDWADAQIDAGATPDMARAAAFEAMAKQPVIRTTSVGWSASDPQVRTAAIADAVHANSGGGTFPDGPARNYAHVRGYHDLAREALSMAGVRTTSFSAADLIERAMSTSDFPILLSSVVGRFVRAGYELATPGVLTLARDQLVPDFKEQKFINIYGPGRLTLKQEGAEIQYGSLGEEYQNATVVTYAAGLRITREAMINDDRGGLSTIPTRLGRAARDEEALRVVDLLDLNTRTGPTLVDGNPLFHTTHSNIHSSPAAPDEAHLAAARLAMRKQTDGAGRRIGVVPSTVLVPADLEQTVRKLLSTVQAAQTSNVNTFSDLSLVVEPRLNSTTRYYTVATNIGGLIIARLEGRAGPQVANEIDFDTKDAKFSVLNDFVPAFIDHRSWFADGQA